MEDEDAASAASRCSRQPAAPVPVTHPSSSTAVCGAHVAFGLVTHGGVKGPHALACGGGGVLGRKAAKRERVAELLLSPPGQPDRATVRQQSHVLLGSCRLPGAAERRPRPTPSRGEGCADCSHPASPCMCHLHERTTLGIT